MRKLSLHENLRHRLNDSLSGNFGSATRSQRIQRDLKRKINRKLKKDVKPALRKGLKHLPSMRREPEHSTAKSIILLTVGIAAGVATGIALAQRYGGFSGISDRLSLRARENLRPDSDSDRFYSATEEGHSPDSDEEYFSSREDGPLSSMEELEERVLEAFRNDPILSVRAIDIGAIEEGVIELTGWVHEADETNHAVIIARGTPGVITVVNRLAVRNEDERFEHTDDDDLLMSELSSDLSWDDAGLNVRNSAENRGFTDPNPPETRAD